MTTAKYTDMRISWYLQFSVASSFPDFTAVYVVSSFFPSCSVFAQRSRLLAGPGSGVPFANLARGPLWGDVLRDKSSASEGTKYEPAQPAAGAVRAILARVNHEMVENCVLGRPFFTLFTAGRPAERFFERYGKLSIENLTHRPKNASTR